MNVTLSFTTHPRNYRTEWRCIPRVRWKRWTSRDGSLWYLHVNWLAGGLVLDNEW